MNRFLHSNFTKCVAFIGSLTTIGVYWLPFQDKALKFFAVGAFILFTFLLGSLLTGQKLEPKVLFKFLCRYCKQKGFVSTKNGDRICPCCDGFGDLLHEIESDLLGDCRLCNSTGRISNSRCKLCKGYGIKPELVSGVVKREAS